MKFGDKILVKASLKRIKGNLINKKSPNYRGWERVEFPSPQEALFLGSRTLSNGVVETEQYSYDEGYVTYFNHQEYIKGAWICIKGGNPEKVFLSDCFHAVCRHELGGWHTNDCLLQGH